MNTRLVESLVGTPFLWGGRSLTDGGLDCWGLTKHALSLVGRPVVESFRHVEAWSDVSHDGACGLMQEEWLEGDWQEVPWEPWVIAWMGTPTKLHHVGVVLPEADRRVLHTTRTHGAVIMRESWLRRVGYSRIIYCRHSSWA